MNRFDTLSNDSMRLVMQPLGLAECSLPCDLPPLAYDAVTINDGSCFIAALNQFVLCF